MNYTRNVSETLIEYVRRSESEIVDVSLTSNYSKETKFSSFNLKFQQLSLKSIDTIMEVGGIGLIAGYFEGKGYQFAKDIHIYALIAPTIYVTIRLKSELDNDIKKKVEEDLKTQVVQSHIYNKNKLEIEISSIDKLTKKYNNMRIIPMGALSPLHLVLNYAAYTFGQYLSKKF